MSRDSQHPPSDSRPLDELARMGRRVLTLSSVGERELSRAIRGDVRSGDGWPAPRLIGADGQVIAVSRDEFSGRPA